MSVQTQLQVDGTYQVSGRLDFNSAPEALQQIEALIHSHKSLVLDLSGIEQSNSAALAVIIECLGVAQRESHELVLAGIPEPVRQLAAICEVDALLPPA